MNDFDTHRSRIPYSPIHDRPALRLPGGARVAVWTIVNVENWDPAQAVPHRAPAAYGTEAAAQLGLAWIRPAGRLLANGLKRIFVDSVVFTPRQLRYLVEVFGAGQLLTGTDYGSNPIRG